MSAAWPFVGHRNADATLIGAISSDRLHHGWILEGPKGVGKSIFARRAAAYLLGANGSSDNPLDIDENDPVAKTCLSGSHPDLRYVERELNDRGKLRQDIRIDQIRALTHFFELKASMGGRRVGIINSVDEMNANGLNALLKTLEEPPGHCILFLISHGTRVILPTVRSRCRTIKFSRLSDEETRAALKSHESADRAAELANGRPGHGLSISTDSAINAKRAARRLLDSLPKPSDQILSRATLAAAADDEAFSAFCDEVFNALSAGADNDREASAIWMDISALTTEIRAINMDRLQAAASLVNKLASSRINA